MSDYILICAVTPTTGNAQRAERDARVVPLPLPAPTEHERVVPITLVRDDVVLMTSTSIAHEVELVGDPAYALKRWIDVAGAIVGLILAAPIILFVAIAVRLESRGPIFFAHRRLGLDGKPFKCWKFRSMRQDAEHELHADDSLREHYMTNDFKIPSHLDPRITKLGRFLRRSSLDELPQLWNVLCGEMSLVGPRPIVPLESAFYAENLPLLLSVRPGLTGAWAVQGRSRVGYPARAAIELRYVREWSLADDVEILLRTPAVVFTQRGAY